jgi:hypothetical protein
MIHPQAWNNMHICVHVLFVSREMCYVCMHEILCMCMRGVNTQYVPN